MDKIKELNPDLIIGNKEENEKEQIQKANPDLVFLSSDPYPFREKHIPKLRPICSKAKVILVDGEMFSWYGSRLLYAPDITFS